jgi:hypothetical protein
MRFFVSQSFDVQNDRYYDNPHIEYSSDGISINFTTRVPYQYSVLENKVGISENLPDLTIQDFITSLIKCIILLYFLITLMQTLLFII